MAYTDVFPLGQIITDLVATETKELNLRIQELEKDEKIVYYLKENFPEVYRQITETMNSK